MGVDLLPFSYLICFFNFKTVPTSFSILFTSIFIFSSGIIFTTFSRLAFGDFGDSSDAFVATS